MSHGVQVVSIVRERMSAGESLGSVALKVVEYTLDHAHGAGPSQVRGDTHTHTHIHTRVRARTHTSGVYGGLSACLCVSVCVCVCVCVTGQHHVHVGDVRRRDTWQARRAQGREVLDGGEVTVCIFSTRVSRMAVCC